MASGDYSLAMGHLNTASGEKSVAMGDSNYAQNITSIAMGKQNTASGSSSVAIGLENKANGGYSVAMGWNNETTAQYSFTIGAYNNTAGLASVAMGWQNEANGHYSVAMGWGNTSSGYASVAMGDKNTANGYYSGVIGEHLNAFNYNNVFVCGKYNSDPGSGSLFVVGKGVLNSPSNIIVVNSSSLKCFGDVIAFASSDYRLKTNLKKIETPLDKIKEINGYTFDWIENSEIHSYKGKDVGVIAQEVEEILPEVVTTRDNGYKGVKYEKLVPLLIECIKSQNKNIDNLENEVHNLKNELSSVNSELTNIKKHLGL